jgi:solute carrier family 25 phosphate transporter 23/24/25/41
MENLIIGGVAGIISRSATAPLELQKIQNQNSHIPHTSWRDVLKLEGPLGLWKGNGTNCVRIFPQMAVNYWTYQHAIKQVEFVPLLEPYKHFIGGFISGATAMIATYPFETIRTYLSLQTLKSEYKTPLDVARKLGPVRIYKGLGTSIMGYGPFNAITFSTYQLYSTYFDKTDLSTFTCRILSGGLSGTTALSITYPSDLIRRRLQTQGFLNTPKYDGIIDCVRKIVKNEGISGLYKGLGSAYMKVFPALAIQFAVLDYMKDKFPI